MGKFDGAAVGGMEYDLTKWRPDPDEPGLEDDERNHRRALAAEPWAGVIPEPPRERVAVFFDQLQDVRLASMEEVDRITRAHRTAILAEWREAHPDVEKDDDEILSAAYRDESIETARERVLQMQTIRQSAAEKQAARIADLVDELTQGHPTAAVVRELPQRPQDMFLGWLTGEFSPESVAAAMQQ